MSATLGGDGRQSPVKDAAQRIKSEGRRLGERAREEAGHLVDERVSFAASYLNDLSEAFREGSETLREQGHGRTASALEAATDEIGGFARHLAQETPGTLWEEVNGLAQRQPALFIGGAFLLGFGMARFLKSSAEEGGTGGGDSRWREDRHGA